MSGRMAIVGVARVGAARVGYCPTGLLCQVGRRTLPSRVGVARIGAARVGATTRYAALRYLEQASFQLTDSGYSEPPFCRFAITCPATAPRPRAGELVVIAVGTLRRRLFGGALETVTTTFAQAAAGLRVYQCQAFGFLRGLQRVKLFASYTNALAGDILRDLFTQYAPLYDTSLIADGPTLANIVLDGVSLLDACTTLAAQARYQFYIDAHRRVVFRSPTTATAPWPLTDSTPCSGLSITEDIGDLRTSQIVRYTTPEIRTQTFLGDGVTREFPLYGDLSDVQALTVDDAPVTFGWRYMEDNSNNDFSIQDGTPAYIATSNHATLAVGQRLTIVFSATFPARVTVHRRAAITARQSAEGGAGIYSQVIERRDLGIENAVALATAELDQHADPEYDMNYAYIEPLSRYFTRRLAVGQQQPVQLDDHDLTLAIQELVLTVIRSADDLTCLLAVQVRLGRQIINLTDLFKTMTEPPDAPVNERIVITYQ